MRKLLIVAFAALAACIELGSRAGAWEGNGGNTGGSNSSRTANGYVLTVRAVDKISAATGGDASGGAGGPRYYYDFAPACRGNSAEDGDALCGPALRTCRRGDPTSILYYVFRGTDPEALANVGTVCLGDADFVDRETLDRAVLAELTRRLPLAAPRVRSAPSRTTLVHLPTVFWAENPMTREPDRPSYQLTATVDDVRVTMRVDGTWTWRLDDGRAERTLHSAGVPYVPGVTPDPRLDPAYYGGASGSADGAGLVASYDTRGVRTVEVTVTWRPSYTVAHEVGVRRLDDSALRYTATRSLRVGEARAVLVSGDGSGADAAGELIRR